MKRGTVTVERSYTTDLDGKPHLKGPKTEAGIRTHVLPPFVLKALRQHIDEYIPDTAELALPRHAEEHAGSSPSAPPPCGFTPVVLSA